MIIEETIWLESIVTKIRVKHAVNEYEVEEIFDDKPRYFFIEKGHRDGENVYSALGQTEDGRYLIVIFIYKQRKALIVFARDMVKGERNRYEKK